MGRKTYDWTGDTDLAAAIEASKLTAAADEDALRTEQAELAAAIEASKLAAAADEDALRTEQAELAAAIEASKQTAGGRETVSVYYTASDSAGFYDHTVNDSACKWAKPEWARSVKLETTRQTARARVNTNIILPSSKKLPATLILDEYEFFTNLAEKRREMMGNPDWPTEFAVEMVSHGYEPCGGASDGVFEVWPLWFVKTSLTGTYATAADVANSVGYVEDMLAMGGVAPTIAIVSSFQNPDTGDLTADPGHVYKDTDLRFALLKGRDQAHFDVFDRETSQVILMPPDGSCFWHSLSYIVNGYPYDGDNRWKDLKYQCLRHIFRVDKHVDPERIDAIAACFYEYHLFDEEIGGILEGFRLAQLLDAKASGGVR